MWWCGVARMLQNRFSDVKWLDEDSRAIPLYVYVGMCSVLMPAAYRHCRVAIIFIRCRIHWNWICVIDSYIRNYTVHYALGLLEQRKCCEGGKPFATSLWWCDHRVKPMRLLVRAFILSICADAFRSCVSTIECFWIQYVLTCWMNFSFSCVSMCLRKFTCAEMWW